MTEQFSSALESHAGLSCRRDASRGKIKEIQTAFKSQKFFCARAISIFCAGSVARLEYGKHSDLDIFVTASNGGDNDEMRSKLFEHPLFYHLIELNEHLEFPPFSNGGEFLKIHFLDDMKKNTGLPKDDSENFFTARMLMILESVPVSDEQLYRAHIKEILDNYYRDKNQNSELFHPIFLLNDILRYWRTLCINYEKMRGDTGKPWRKKNINLKFSRMMTVFATVLPLLAKPITSVEIFLSDCLPLSPLARLAAGLDCLDDICLLSEWKEVLDIYSEFLAWKDEDDTEDFYQANKEMVNDKALCLSKFLHKALTHDGINEEYRRRLVL